MSERLKPFIHWRQKILQQLQPAPDSADYRAWRHRFMLDRLHICLWVAVIGYIASSSVEFYRIFLDSSQLKNDIATVLGDPSLFDRYKNSIVLSLLVSTALLTTCATTLRTCWGQRRPELLFFSFSASVSLIPDHIIPLLFGLPTPPNTFVFMAQAILIPVYWRLHLVSQLLPILCYVGVYPLLGLTKLGTRSIYDSRLIVELLLVCLICDLGVYLYERLKRSEFEAQRRLHVFFHTISHELRTPVMGASMLLRSLLPRAVEGEVRVKTDVVEQLVAGNDRLLSLMNSLLDIQTGELRDVVLQRKSIQLRSLVDSVLADLQPLLAKNRIRLTNEISENMPAISVDPQQIWRVWCNLISNALKHNPPGIELRLTAEFVERDGASLQRMPPLLTHSSENYQTALFSGSDFSSDARSTTQRFRDDSQWIHCSIQDSGVGIPSDQCQRIFELYSRGTRDRYTPGLGLGLYVCRQIITAHEGEIGVISQPNQGSTFWFTLPISRESFNSHHFPS